MPNEAEEESKRDNQEAKGEDVGKDPGRIGLEPEGAFMRNLGNPSLPSQEAVERHRLQGHVVYRNWCPECVKSRGKEMDHKRDKGGIREVPEYHWDYCFPGDEMGFKWTVLVGRERKSGMVMYQ